MSRSGVVKLGNIAGTRYGRVHKKPVMKGDIRGVPHSKSSWISGPRELGHKLQQSLIGEVVSTKMQKTVNVNVVHFVLHPVIDRYVRKSTRIMAHDENEEAKVGDIVEIKQSRPISRHKHHLLYRIVQPYPVFDWNTPAPEPFTHKTVPDHPDKRPFPWVKTWSNDPNFEESQQVEATPAAEQSAPETTQGSESSETSSRYKGYSKNEMERRRKREREAALRKSLFENYEEKKKSIYARK